MGRRAQADKGPPRRDPPTERGPGPHPRPTQETQGRPSLNVGPAFARTLRHFFPRFNSFLDNVPDPRRPDRTIYSARFLLWYGFLLFAGKLGSRRQLDFQYREAGACVLDNLNRLAQTHQQALPCNDTLDDYLAGVPVDSVAKVRTDMIKGLIRMRVLDAARVQGRLVAAVDGSGYLAFRWEHCEHCLKRTCGEGTSYSHQVLEAKILGPAETVLSLGSEFIDNHDCPAKGGEEKRKQDCELKAMRRLLGRVRRDHPLLRLCLTLDALSACGAAFALAEEFDVSFVTVFEEGRLPSLWQEFQVLLALCPEQRRQREDEEGWKHVYRWVDDLPYTDSDKRQWKLQAIEYEGEGPLGQKSRWAWLVSADLEVSEGTVEGLVWGAGRPRWREENQGFNVQKNSGLRMEHAYTQKGHFGCYYLLMQIAHLVLQLVEKGSLLRQLAREAGKGTAVGLLGSLANIAAFLVESLRNWAWPDEVFADQGGIQIRLDSS